MRQANILIVDDSDFDRKILKRALGKTGLTTPHVEEAPDADAAISSLNAGAFDAVFLDINMPGKNGFHVLGHMRDRNLSTWPMVFMLSSSTHPDDVDQAYRGKATAYLAKPVDLAEMQIMANSCLGMVNETVALS